MQPPNVAYCLPLRVPFWAQVFEAVRAHSSTYAAFEVWLDYVEDLQTHLVSDLALKLPERVIYTLRRPAGQLPYYNWEKRAKILQELGPRRAFIDLDLQTETQAIDFVRSQGLRMPIIASYHNYESTPDDSELSSWVEKALSYSPEIIKVATLCNSTSDAQRLLGLMCKLRSTNKRVIVTGMGEHGRIVRLAGALGANEFTFAPLESGDATAPGQLTVTKFNQLLTELYAS